MGLPIPKWGGGLGPGIQRQPKALSLKNGRGSGRCPVGTGGEELQVSSKSGGGP